MVVIGSENAMLFRQLYNPDTMSFTYLVSDPSGRLAVLVDPVAEQVERDLKLLADLDLELALVLLTYSDDNKIEAARAIRNATNAKVVSKLGPAGAADAQVDGGEILDFATSPIEVLATPGYCDDSVSFLIGRRVFTGGALSPRHCGNGGRNRVDPERLFDSVVDVLFQLPDDTLVYPAHHHGGVRVTTVGDERRFNPELAARDREAFLEAYRRRTDPPRAEMWSDCASDDSPAGEGRKNATV
jgi:glyoxylase-like metal-dependent hydrolase (beta-lactamase superfamily II)